MAACVYSSEQRQQHDLDDADRREESEQAVAGAGWAMLMPMALFGGAMMPQCIMPGWMQTVGQVSPIKWAILGLEGAIWRGFSAGEMVMPCAILLSFGALCVAVGLRGLCD